MRAAERELAEIERKKSAAEAMSGGAGIVGRPAARDRDSAAELSKERMDTLLKEIKTESQRLAQARIQLSKAKSNKTAAAATSDAKSAATSAAPRKKAPVAVTTDASSDAAAISAVGLGKILTTRVPDGYLPELCKLIAKAGMDGIQKVVIPFVAAHPSLAKRQVEMKISEIAIKERRHPDTRLVTKLL
jgi:hypothetical protein